MCITQKFRLLFFFFFHPSYGRFCIFLIVISVTSLGPKKKKEKPPYQSSSRCLRGRKIKTGSPVRCKLPQTLIFRSCIHDILKPPQQQQRTKKKKPSAGPGYEATHTHSPISTTMGPVSYLHTHPPITRRTRPTPSLYPPLAGPVDTTHRATHTNIPNPSTKTPRIHHMQEYNTLVA